MAPAGKPRSTATRGHGIDSGAAAPEPLARARFDSPVGTLNLAASNAGAVMVAFVGREREAEAQSTCEPGPRDARAPGTCPPPQPAARALAHLAALQAELAAYFTGTLPGGAFTVPLDLRGTPFQLEVWNALVAIPYGTRASYGELARRVERPAAVRAVGAANGANPIAIVVPCHRVVAADGSLHGYGGGLERKAWLLAHEAEHAPGRGARLF